LYSAKTSQTYQDAQGVGDRAISFVNYWGRNDREPRSVHAGQSIHYRHDGNGTL